ncbi:ATP-dependent DNA helicase RecG [Candidatus Kaiserbacteria bacterium CG10_big_fil_rev_8_21_14_0_10_49_17]|uniref:Probable DNA 3'-5' helicase RecG n=1 Tax=Candidatus Kaiserbacteria bacterium CG10_big_fil_rev_8_21_14_0_10_49_17 TaxID=1974609 RepID=A0A2M6WDZ1_9BACT|nr:MAG: ATP-dependent DNA helicase RecG [Candidatus Kaiserbacteria bacterium CG10_big_fil_rev_8_21_14_0_10_49_17]
MKLTDAIEEHFRLLKPQKAALARLSLVTINDLLYHFPTRYENISDIKNIEDLSVGDSAIIYGIVDQLKSKKSFKRRLPVAEGRITDRTGSMKIIWFNQPYLAKMLASGVPVKLSGKVTGEQGSLYLANPEVETLPELPIDSHDSLFGENGEAVLYPIYPESRGITSKWFFHALKRVLMQELLDSLLEPIPADILKTYNLPKRSSAFVFIHAPKQQKDADAARKRFAFEEVFAIQLGRQQDRAENKKRHALPIAVNRSAIDEFVERFPFSPTRAQVRAIEDIVSDFEKPHPMSRLLEGDVGSGKTAVATATVYATAMSRPPGQDFGQLQTAYMAPTEILAKQQFESFVHFFEHLPVSIGLITGSGCKKFPSKVNPKESTTISRAQLMKWVENGEIPILVGTHALIQKSVVFKNLAYVVIDEQHRFGTLQRKRLARKDAFAPHLLSMTATPIPRTLALTIYGDLDLSILDEQPEGRKQIKTAVIAPDAREKTYESIRTEMQTGRQLYVICPRIDEPDPNKEKALNAKSVKEEAKRLKHDIFPEYEIEILHSKMTPNEKEEVMNRFASGETHILVATSVVEVGVNVPNATMIIIEGAERFGLAQLHQLRGRVMRSSHQPYCYLFSESKSKTSIARLKALTSAKNGFELAEHDLGLRGAGELGGRKQWGISDIGMEAIKNVKMVEAARNEAVRLIEKDPTLKDHPLLQALVSKRASELHFE